MKKTGPDDDPLKLTADHVVQAEGTKIYGRGFVFDDKDDQANPLSLRLKLLSQSPDLEPRLPAYIGGDEVVSSPTHAYYRWVINVTDIAEEDELKERFPELEEILRNMVKPGRDKLRDTTSSRPLKKHWWKYQAHRPAFYKASENLERILAICKVSAHLSFAFIPTGMIYSSKLVVFASDKYAFFCVLQSRCHEAWTQAFGGIRGDGYYYTPSDCYDTFAMPSMSGETCDSLEEAGKRYYDYLAALLIENDEGLTDTYNRFHDPDERDPDTLKLRELHTTMDRAVLDAYGWNDIPVDCEFLLDYEIDQEDWEDKKKPYRYRWPDEIRDEVLARLLELNAERAKEEARAGAAAAKKVNNKGAVKRAPKASGMEDLFS